MARLSLHTVKEFAESGYITSLRNLPEDRFLWDKNLEVWYDHTKAKVGDKFWDGNNGDRHVVHYVNQENHRMVVENVGQREGLYEMWYW